MMYQTFDACLRLLGILEFCLIFCILLFFLTKHVRPCLKTLDTIGNCQRHNKPVKFELTRSSKKRDTNESKKTPWSHYVHTKLCAFRCLISRPQTKSEVSKSNSLRITFFRKLLTSEGAVSHNV